MERYSEYKDSGVQWLGMIPNHWEFCRFKNITSLITTPSNSSHKIGLENIESGTGKYVFSESEFEGNGIQFEIGDIVYGKLRPYLQKVWKATFSGNAVGDFFVFRPNYKVDRNYLVYLMLSKGFTDDVNSSTYGAKMPRVSSDYIMTMRCGIPPFPEQQSIAVYLDAVTGKIDKAIAQQQKMIGLLNERKQIIINNAVTKGLNPDVPMKDSGIDWIGEIPAHWSINRFKNLFKTKTGITFTKAQLTDLGKPVISYGQIHSKDNWGASVNPILIRHIPHILAKNREDALAYKGDFLFADTSEDFEGCGNCVCIDRDDPIYAGYHTIIAKKNNNECDSYLAYLFASSKWRGQVRTKVNGVKVYSITQSILNTCIIVLPPIQEQKDISNYITKRINLIDAEIKRHSERIKLFQERKQIIINEVVTGKVKVS